jgi:hypothetical protein
MKLPKFLLAVSVLTFVSILYVYQQTEIFRLAYSGQKRVSVYQELLDKNIQLRYNIEKSGSLTRIGTKISKRLELQMPDSYRLVKVPAKQPKVPPQPARGQDLASRIFSVKRQAEAKTIGP